MVTYMQKLTVERKTAESGFKTLATEAPLTPTTMSEAASLLKELAYLDKQLARYNGKRPLLSRPTKPKYI